MKTYRFLIICFLAAVALTSMGVLAYDPKASDEIDEKPVVIKPRALGFLPRLFRGKYGSSDDDDDEYGYDDDDEYDDDEDYDEDERGSIFYKYPSLKFGSGSDSSDYDDVDDDSDCDNGDDSDDGLQWEAQQVKRPDRRTGRLSSLQGLTPFPQWLTDITGLRQWPGNEPPYIPQESIILGANIPNVPTRVLGSCEGIDATHCSFDCFRCTTPDDIFTCPLLSQTFDDGPGPATPKLLDNLSSKTTFFTQGINVVRFPETFRLQHAKGHLLASHTWSHPHLAELTNEQIAAQIQWSIWAMNATAGIVPKYFRPPYGASDNRIRAITRQFGLTSVFWDRDTFDWMVPEKRKTAEMVFEDVQQWRRELPQGLILEHDSTIEVVNIGIQVADIISEDRQMTVAECVNAPWYQNIQQW